MIPHFWIEFKGWKKITVFAFAVLLLAIFCHWLPASAYLPRRGLGRRDGLPMPFWLIATWAGGWFVLLFLRVEDLHVRLPFDYTGQYRFIAFLLLSVSAIMAGILYALYRIP